MLVICWIPPSVVVPAAEGFLSGVRRGRPGRTCLLAGRAVRCGTVRNGAVRNGAVWSSTIRTIPLVINKGLRRKLGEGLGSGNGDGETRAKNTKEGFETEVHDTNDMFI